MSRGAVERHAREMAAAGKEGDNQLDFGAWLSLDHGLRSGARRAPRPGDARLESRSPAGGALTEVDFVGRGPFQAHV